MKKGLSFRSLRFSRDILGVDLGSHTVKVLQVRVFGKRVFVIGHASQEVWPRLAEAATDDARRDVYVDVLRKLLQSQRFRSRRAAFSLSGNATLVRFFRLVHPYKVDSRTGIPEEAKALSPFGPQDTSLEVRFLNQDSTGADAMAVIGQRTAINGALAILHRAKLRPSVVLNDPLALENAIAVSPVPDFSGAVVLIHIGAATTSLSIVEGSVTRVARTFNIAGDALTRALKREFAVSFEEAESLKKEYGLFGNIAAASGRQFTAPNEAFRIYNETAVRVFKALEPSVSDLIAGIHQTIDAYSSKRRGEEAAVGGILLSGGGAALKSLPEVLRQETGLSVEIFDPLASAVVKHDKFETAQSAAFAVCYGLALTGYLRGNAAVAGPNMLPLEAKRSAARRNAARVLVLLALAVGTVWGGSRILEHQLERLSKTDAPIGTTPKAAAPGAPEKAPADPSVKPKPVSRYAYLGRLRFSGAFSDVIMLSGGGTEYVVKAGRLFDESGQEVPGVATSVTARGIVLTAGGEDFVIRLPK